MFNNTKTIHLEAISKEAIKVICFALFIVMSAHVVNLPVWVSLFVAVTLIWRLAQNQGYIPPLHQWLLVPLVIMGGVGVFVTYHTITGRDAGLALLCVMTAFKLLESKTHRDALILIFLSYFLLITHFLFSQSILIAVYMFVTLLFLTAALISLNERNITLDWQTRFKLSASLLAYALPIMVILFILVPRVPGPLWGLTHEQRSGVTGLSDHMSPGKISNLIQDNSVAFRVQFEGDIPPQKDLYWRGPVLSQFNGQTWFQTKNKKSSAVEISESGKKYQYTTTLEANGKNWLLPLDRPSQTITDSTLSYDFELKSDEPINDLKKYTLISHAQAQIGLNDSFEYLSQQMFYPENYNIKTIAFGKQLRDQFTTDKEIINFVLNKFRSDNYYYTLQPPLLNTHHVDDFLFNTKRGFCEHYSSSFALLMRAAGIPARVVTGYQGGELNAGGNYLIVRQSDAHAWTEVWDDDNGWIRIDPTAAVSPDRVEYSLEQALSHNNESYQFKAQNALFGDILLNWDNVQFQWNNWVLNYNDQKQASFLKNLGLGINNASDMIIWLVILILLLTMSYGLISWYRHLPKPLEYYEQLFLKVKKKCAKQGVPFYASETPNAFLLRVSNSPNITFTSSLEIFIKLYMRIKYSDSQNKPALIIQLKKHANLIKINLV